uniref:Transposase n=1 Tax=Oncorhynchus tshawytscha TaxID=74940 RepID=A0A8C8IKV7_ONCTS
MKRKYSDEFLSLGFVQALRNNEDCPQCVFCGEVLSNESLKTNKLKRHVLTKHPQYDGKPREFFQNRAECFSKQCFDSGRAFKGNRAIHKASYQVNLNIAKAMKPHIIGEEFIKPCLRDVCVSLSEEAAKKVDSVPLSNGTVGKRDGRLHFRVVDTHLKDLQIDWANCVGICTDGARCMTGSNSGFIAHVLQSGVKLTHCILHRESLASKALQPNQGAVFDSVVKMVNLIKKRPLQTRLFTELCKEMRGRVLERLWDLREAVLAYQEKEDSDLADLFRDKLWLAMLAYLVDIFRWLNKLNSSLQGKESTILEPEDGIRGFTAPLGLWQSQLKAGAYGMFPVLSAHMQQIDSPLCEAVKKDMAEHMASLQQKFDPYFSNPQRSQTSMGEVSLFQAVSSPDLGLSLPEMEALVTLQASNSSKMLFDANTLTQSWVAHLQQEAVSCLSEKAVDVLVQFGTTYLCESGFSTLAYLKNKYRNRLNPRIGLLVKLQPATPLIRSMFVCWSTSV